MKATEIKEGMIHTCMFICIHLYICILFSKKKVDDIFNIDENMSQAHITRIKVI